MYIWEGSTRHLDFHVAVCVPEAVQVDTLFGFQPVTLPSIVSGWPMTSLTQWEMMWMWSLTQKWVLLSNVTLGICGVRWHGVGALYHVLFYRLAIYNSISKVNWLLIPMFVFKILTFYLLFKKTIPKTVTVIKISILLVVILKIIIETYYVWSYSSYPTS